MQRNTTSSPSVMLPILASGAVVGFFAYINTVPPDSSVRIAGFFILLALAVFLSMRWASVSPRTALLCCAGIIILLILRFAGLRHPLYAVLVTAGVISAQSLLRRG